MKKLVLLTLIATVFSGSAFAAMDDAKSAKCADIIKNLKAKAAAGQQGADGQAAPAKDAK